MATLYSELYDLIIDYLVDDTPALTACSLVSRVLLPRCQHHLFRHITFYPGDNRCARIFADKALLVEELTIYERRLPGDKGMRTDVGTEALPRMLPLLVSLRRAKFSGQMYLDAMHRVWTGVQGVLAQLKSITLDGVFFSNLAEVASFFGCMPHLKRLAMNVVTVGGDNNGDEVYQGGLCKELETLKVGTGNLRPRWMRFLFGRDGVIWLENLRDLVFPVTSEVDSWMPGVHELVYRAPRLESAMLLDWRGSHQNLDHITPVPDIGHLRWPDDVHPSRIYRPIRGAEGPDTQEYQGETKDAGYASSFREGGDHRECRLSSGWRACG
ncbi:hypothetical protein IW261DRAFT_1564726 [Armillaria novae-zelandiae]|uniref:Uncharacterized protein n=1 Tax=Armillaria novae-zelandiae TaxID=153914 RepID=A0AA39U7Q4_9AGAR|nr:hypothetical protein IW261DRAFT_1564726 [Armillaria novae-zelandiae]